MTVEGLIERLERATGPDRELDWAIAEHLGWAYEPGVPSLLLAPSMIDPDGNARHLPAYTASLDAALTLAGERSYACLLEGMAMAAAYFVTFSDKNGHIVRALPRFVCIAALRAREAS